MSKARDQDPVLCFFWTLVTAELTPQQRIFSFSLAFKVSSGKLRHSSPSAIIHTDDLSELGARNSSIPSWFDAVLRGLHGNTR
jgi:hypothetical protein